MAIYLKCTGCGNYYMDMFGEYAIDNPADINNYYCTKCGGKLEQVEDDEYYKADENLQNSLFKDFEK